MGPRRPRPRKTAKTRWQTREPAAPKPKVVVVGFGRLGGAISLGLKKAGWPIKVFPRSGESTRRAVRLNLQLADAVDLRSADICVLAVPDSVVRIVGRKVREDVGPTTALVHCAGALDLSVFGEDAEAIRRPRGSFHPLCAVSDPTDELAGHTVALASSERELMPILWRMALALRLRPIEVPEAQRALYHAGAVLSAGLTVALLSTAVEALTQAGIEDDAALAALLPLTRSALRGIEHRGLSRGLTGPVCRGDLAVVEAHLNSLPDELRAIYRALSVRSLQLVRDQLPKETVDGLTRLLT